MRRVKDDQESRYDWQLLTTKGYRPMRWFVRVAATALVVMGSAGRIEAAPELIGLRDGHQVTGEVVAEKAGALYVDLGFDILRIPRDQIVHRGKPGEGPGAAPARSSDTDPGGFWTAGPLRPASVKELVHQYGEAVISIETPSGKGSGFLVNDDGYAVTNNHVIEGETRISAILYQNTPGGLARRRIENVEIVALNPFMDLALLRLPPQKDLKYTHTVLGSLDDLNAGDGAFAVGNPLGLERSVSQGIVSTRNRNIEGLVYLQTDAAINPGNSGGPLFNLRGEVVGVTSLKATRGENLGFAIPVSYVKDFLRNREAFSFDKNNPNTGYHYLDPPRRLRAGRPPRAARVSHDQDKSQVQSQDQDQDRDRNSASRPERTEAP
jgi:serine protease Do